jgi:hypothetical protein
LAFRDFRTRLPNQKHFATMNQDDSPGKISFYNSHHPALPDGSYEFTLTQEFKPTDYPLKGDTPKGDTPKGDTPKGDTSKRDSPTFSTTVSFVVNGPRFVVPPSEIHSVFPPVGGKGDYRGSLPTLVFQRSTLPWERTPFESYMGDASWLFLLLVEEDESVGVTEMTCTYADLGNSEKRSDLGKGLGILNTEELKWIDPKTSIQYLTITNEALRNLIPGELDDLTFLSYVRIKSSDNNEEHSVLTGNRLPKPGSNSTVYLISLENKYTDGKPFDHAQRNFPYLYKWSFHTLDEQLYSIDSNLKKLEADNDFKPFLDKLSAEKTIYTTTEDFNKARDDGKWLGDAPTRTLKGKLRQYCKLPGSSFHELLSNLRGGASPLRLPEAGAEAGIGRSGSVSMPLQMVEAGMPRYFKERYRGAFTAAGIALDNAAFLMDTRLHGAGAVAKPIFVREDGFIPVKADELVIRTPAFDDYTYAAAYELGKLTALSDDVFSKAFFEWKHDVATAKQFDLLKGKANYLNADHLSTAHKYDAKKPIPSVVLQKISNWQLLKGMPSRYLIPHPDMLPKESLRYFLIDNHWVNAFICGAFSIGHTVKADFKAELKSLFLNSTRSGILVNSMAVSAWPDYELDAYDSPQPHAPAFPRNGLTPLRKTNLDKSTHLYLFDGIVRQLYFHLHPGKLHPGFMVEENQFKKDSLSGYGDIANEADHDFSSCLDQTARTLNIGNLKTRFQDISKRPVDAAQFNAFLMEGTPEVVFEIGG